MKQFIILVSIFLYCNTNAHSQSTGHLSLSKLFEIITSYPTKQKKEIQIELSKQFGFKDCSSNQSDASNFKSCKNGVNGEVLDIFEFTGGSNSKSEIISQIEYTIADIDRQQSSFYESYLLSNGFSNSYTDKDEKKFIGNYGFVGLRVNIYFFGKFAKVLIINNPSY